MIAFAANSVLNRAALAEEEISPLVFSWIRAGSGACALALMVLARDRRLTIWGPQRIAGVLSLTIYMIAFFSSLRNARCRHWRADPVRQRSSHDVLW